MNGDLINLMILPSAYGTTWRGIWKMFILVIGGAAFGLLVNYAPLNRSCQKTG